MTHPAEEIKNIIDLMINYAHKLRQSHHYLDELLDEGKDLEEIARVKKELKLRGVAVKKTVDIVCHLTNKVYNLEGL